MRPPAALLLLAALLATGSTVRLPAQEPAPSGRLREVRIITGDVFDDQTAEERPLARLLNAFHWETRQEVIRREVWLVPGHPIDSGQAAELERNLRALGLFADVSVHLVATGTAGEYDLVIETRDRMTLIFGAGASHVGGVTGFRAAIGESNLFGYGNRIGASFARNSDGEYRGSLVYTDLHLFDSWHTSTIRLSKTDDGDSVGLEVRRPFKHLTDPMSYRFSASHDEGAVTYYEDGDERAKVRDHHSSFYSDLLWATGPTHQRNTMGFALVVDRHEHGPAGGPLAARIRVPGDTTSVFLGPTSRWQWIHGYRKVTGLDTLNYVQDLKLGVDFGLTLGGRLRDEQGLSPALQPEIAVEVAHAAELVHDLYTNVFLRGTGRWGGSSVAGWTGTAAAQAFAMLSEKHTLGLGLRFDTVEEKQDLPPQLTLGEDNGLRGYRARQFAGTERLRINLEHRFDTGVEVATLRLGLVGFFDTGAVAERSGLGRAYSSCGVGLRIGSKQLLGDGVMRLDLAKPLDHVPSNDDGVKFSIAIGQVFTFGGDTSPLSLR